MRDLSSKWTWFYKFALPALWIGGFAAISLSMIIAPNSWGVRDFRELGWVFLAVTVFGTVLFYWSCMRLKRVRLRGDVLLISNFETEIEVPLRDVERVSGSLLVNPELMWLRFRRPTEFGTKVVFMPPFRFFHGFTRHPLVEELQEILNAASGKSNVGA
ncbi:MAG: hypothetical protein LAO31_06795 [Acidobacteriia bacterium]|nr:hypothetical protein [Terriglobia bacterium]